MSKHLVRLQLLFDKLEARYGADDPDVRGVADSLKALEELERQSKAPNATLGREKAVQLAQRH